MYVSGYMQVSAIAHTHQKGASDSQSCLYRQL